MDAVFARCSVGRLVLPSMGMSLVAAGLILLGLVVRSFWQPGAAPYRYQWVEQAGVERIAESDLQAWPDLAITKVEIRASGLDQPLAVGQVARRGQGAPVMLDWDNRSGEPLVFTDTRLGELKTLAQAVSKHAPKDALLLAWWDTARQLHLLTGLDVAYDTHLREPLIAPAPWRTHDRSIARYEREFWGAPPSRDDMQRFGQFAEALASEAGRGAAMLRAMAGEREAYVVVHVSDLYKLGVQFPDRFGVAYKDLTLRGDVHGQIAFVKRWVVEHDYAGYTVHELSPQQARAYAVGNARTAATLLARMLPLSTSQPAQLQVLELVYQHGGYWVYRLPARLPAG
ncbi:MAG: hydroxylamine oxidation protein HaoB [Lautropia sp. SCN 69-89]|nr:MAG: hydroxylamine oxidation protein HaoB [Lautropia sp. SCN 69-89]